MNIISNIVSFLKTIYQVRYQICCDKLWYCNHCNTWIEDISTHFNLCKSDILSSHLEFKKKTPAIKEFDKLAEQKIDCSLCRIKHILGKSWYFTKDWYSVDHDIFSKDLEKDLK